MDLTEVQTLADEAVRQYRHRCDGATAARDTAIEAALTYAASDTTEVGRDAWPRLDLEDENAYYQGRLMQAVVTLTRVEAEVWGDATPNGWQQWFRFNGARTRIEATLVVWNMLSDIMFATSHPQPMGEWVHHTMTELGIIIDGELIAAVRNQLETKAFASLDGARQWNAGPLKLKATATAQLIHTGWRVYKGDSATEIAQYVDTALGNNHIDDSNGREIATWSDATTQRWLKVMDPLPPAATWRQVAKQIATTMAPERLRAAAAIFTQVDPDSRDRGWLAREQPVAAAIGAAATAAALLTVVPDPNQLFLDAARGFANSG